MRIRNDGTQGPKGNPQVAASAETVSNVSSRVYQRRKRFRTAPNPPDKTLLTEEEAAYLLDLEPESLAVFRSTGRHQIPYIKIGRNVRYRRSDLEAWLISRTHTNGVTGEKIQGKYQKQAGADVEVKP